MIRVGIVGASGYTGSELLRLLAAHREVEIAYLTAGRHAGQRVDSLNKGFLTKLDLVFEEFDPVVAKARIDFAFIALPHGKSMEVVPPLLEAGIKLVDLSGDFRFLDKGIYESWYKIEHKAPALLGKATYGLCEIYRSDIAKSSFVANPGCFPTGAALALAPALKLGLIEAEDIIIDSLTGTSGAGRSGSDDLHFSEVAENLSSYKVGGVHQHIPEIESELSKLAGVKAAISFTPHLAPFSRGIYTTAYAKLKEVKAATEIISAYKEFYGGDRFVKVMNEGFYPEVKSVAGSNFCQIGLALDGRTNRLIIISAIDNLIKGASGQAIQNMNLMLGLKEEEGLLTLPLRP